MNGVNFASSQYRSKVYVVKMAACFPVQTQAGVHPTNDLVCGIEYQYSSESDSDTDLCLPRAPPRRPTPTPPARIPIQQPRHPPQQPSAPALPAPPVRVEPPTQNLEQIPPGIPHRPPPSAIIDVLPPEVTTTPVVNDMPTTPPQRRSTRSTRGRPPSWLSSSSWELSQEAAGDREDE